MFTQSILFYNWYYAYGLQYVIPFLTFSCNVTLDVLFSALCKYSCFDGILLLNLNETPLIAKKNILNVLHIILFVAFIFYNTEQDGNRFMMVIVTVTFLLYDGWEWKCAVDLVHENYRRN